MIGHVKTNLLSFFYLMTPLLAIGNEVTLQYIEKYKIIAINEMHRTGIPASIKLAQGIHESASGRSVLAKDHNNHFGIKCGSRWDGKTFFRHDDDYNNGLLVKSCFRTYRNPYQSYIDHSEFLANPNSKRYNFLFDLNPLDYKAWARGLKKAGYASDKRYAEKLISIIENYNLHLYDAIPGQAPEEEIVAVGDDVEQPRKTEKTVKDARKKHSATKSKVINHLPVVQRDVHIVASGETMAGIASLHNMKLQELYFKNRMPYGSQPRVGEKLMLENYLHFKKRPALVDNRRRKASESSVLFEETISISSE